MSTWHLTVKTRDAEHVIPLGPDESTAMKALQEAGKNVGMNGRVTIAERLVVMSETILSVSIHEAE
jgi:hypothetical protein